MAESAIQRLTRLVEPDLVELSQVWVRGYDRPNPRTGKIEHVNGYFRSHHGGLKSLTARYLRGRDRQVVPVAVPGTVRKTPRGRYDPNQPWEFWGNRLDVKDLDDPVTRENLDRLAMVPEGVAYSVRNLMAQTDGAGIYIGRGSASEVAGLDHLTGKHPRGWSADSTFAAVDGLYAPKSRRIGLGHNATTDRRAAGEKSAALHEIGHALDAAFVEASNSGVFLQLANQMQVDQVLDPYYSAEANPDGYRSEMYAQAFGAWAKGRAEGLSRGDLNRSIRWDLGTSMRAIPKVDAMIQYFDDVERELKLRYRDDQDILDGKLLARDGRRYASQAAA